MKRKPSEESQPASEADELIFLEQEIEALRYALSHDLRAPIRAIMGYAKILEEDYGHLLGDEGLGFVERIASSGRRLEGQVSGLVQLLSLIQAEVEHSEVDLSQIARDIAHQLDESSPERRVTWSIQEGMRVQADERMMRSALANLLSNAWKYTSENPNAKVEFGQTETEGKACYFVSDNGIGFPASDAGKIFQPFWKYEEKVQHQGVGTGLATVDRIIRRHGGRIRAASEPGKGATFTFTLS